MIYNFCMAANSEYIKYFCVLVQCIMGNLKGDTKSDSFIFYLLCNEDTETSRISLMEQRLKKQFSIQIKICSIDSEIFKKIGVRTWGEGENYTAYFRLIADSVLPVEVKTILYLDIDVVVCCDIRNFFSLDLEGNVAGGMRDLRIKKENLIKGINTEDFVFSDDGTYVNSGILLIDLEMWRRDEIGIKAIEFMKNHSVIYPDQDAINAVLKNRIKVFEQRWNIQPIMVNMKRNREGDWIAMQSDTSLPFKLSRDVDLDNEIQETKLFHMTSVKPWGKVADLINYGLADYTNPIVLYALKSWRDAALNVVEFKDELYPAINNFTDIVLVRFSSLMEKRYQNYLKFKRRSRRTIKILSGCMFLLFIYTIYIYI